MPPEPPSFHGFLLFVTGTPVYRHPLDPVLACEPAWLVSGRTQVRFLASAHLALQKL